MVKNVNFGSEGRKKLTNGVNTISNAVKITLGAKGRNVIIGNGFGGTHITKDGVTVAKSIELECPIENMGASLIKEVASKTVDIAGDGTTTSTLLAQSIINLGLKSVESGANPMDLKRGIEKATSKAIEVIKSLSKEVVDNDTLEQIATISANNDNYIGKLISDAMLKVGRDGLISIEESKSYETTTEIADGMKIDRGYLSPYFVTDNNKMVSELNNPYILIYDKKISVMKDIIFILEKVAQTKRPLLIISEDLDGEALATLVVNKLRGVLSICAIKAPGFGENRNQLMEDIAVMVGGVCLSEEKGLKLESSDLTVLGSASKVTVTKDGCTIIAGGGLKSDIQTKCDEIKSQLEQDKSIHEKEKLKARLANLTNGVAILKIGGVTETEIKEKKDRIDDALCATRSAIEEGYVAGGGVSYLYAISKIEIDYESIDEKIGGDIIIKSLESPFRQILENGGIEPSEHISFILKSEYGIGYNIKTNQIENFFESGVIDPTKVLRVALENASSIASIFLTTDCVISEQLQNK
jgi:chaperonin GroEL